MAEPAVLDDQAAIIHRRLKELQQRQYVCVEVYLQGTRQEVSGEVVFIDDEIIVVGEEEILIKNILGIFNEAEFLEDKLFGEKDRYDSFIHMANEQEIELTDNDIKCDDFDIVVFSSMC